MLSCWSLVLLFLSLTSIITSSNVTFEFKIDHNCQYPENVSVTFYTMKKEDGTNGVNDQVLYSCSAKISPNASVKFNPSVPRNQLGSILYWCTESACNINVSDVHIPCGINGSSQTESTRCNKCSAVTDAIKCARVDEIDFYSNCDSLQCLIVAPAQGVCSVESSSNNLECRMASTSTTSSLMFTSIFHDSSSTIMTLTTEYLSASATQYSSSAFVSSDMFSSSFPLISPTPLESSQPISASPSPTSLNCPLDPPWPQTLAGHNATNTCHKGLFNATRYCNESGNWEPVICFADDNFEAIVLLASSSPYNALVSLSNSINTIPAIQTAVLLDIIASSNSRNATTEEFGQLLMETFDQLLKGINSSLYDEEVRRSIGSQVLSTLDSFALSLTQDFNASLETIVVNVLRIQPLTTSDLIGINYEGNKIVLPSEIYNERDQPFTVGSFVYADMSSFLSPRDNRISLVSPVVSSALNCSTLNVTSDCVTSDLSQKVVISFNLTGLKIPDNFELSCQFWNFTRSDDALPSGFWVNSGCRNLSSSETAQEMMSWECDHLTHFAILLSPRSDTGSGSLHNEILTNIGRVLVPISLLCMVLVILTYSCMRSLWNMRNYIHVMLCANLSVSQLIFVIGIEQTSNKSVCSGIAVVLQYMFLVSFMWMLMEGVVLYVTLVKVFIKYPKRYIIGFTLISYVVPGIYMAVVVPIGFLVGSKNHYLYYVNNDLIACWLDYESGFIWTFIAPVILMIIANIGFLIMAIVIMKKHQSRKTGKSQTAHARHWIRASLSLTIIMGIGWIGNVLFFSKELIFIAYIMTVFIAGQGIIIFILYVPLSKHVREAYKKWWSNKTARFRPLQSNETKEIRIMTSHENNYVESVSVNKENHENIYSEINSDSKTSSL